MRISSAWARSTWPIDTPKGVGLEDGEHERAQLGHVAASLEVAHGVGAGRAGALRRASG